MISIFFFIAKNKKTIQYVYKVPDSWREGLHYTRSGKHVFSCAETVIAIRSNGKKKKVLNDDTTTKSRLYFST